jgi:hypothetical protein
VPPEPLAGLDSRAGDPRDQAPTAEPGDVAGGEVRLIGMWVGRSPPARSAPGADGRYRQDQRLERLAVVQVRPGHRMALLREALASSAARTSSPARF